MNRRTPKGAIACLCCVMLFCCVEAFSDEPKPPPAAPHPEKLSQQQRQIADQFKHLEDVLLRMAELTAASDPRRAALLKKAVAQSKEQLLDGQFDRLVQLLQKDQLSRALEGQAAMDQDLRALLDLLLSENRAKQLEAQKKRLQEYLKRVNELIKEQKNIQGRTAGGENTKPLSDEQGKLTEKTGSLAQQVKTNEEGKAKSERQDQSKTPDQGKSEPKGKPQRPEPDGGKRAEKEQKKGQPQGGDQDRGQPKSEEDREQSNQPQDQSRGQNAMPARQRLEAARDRMREAEAKLKQAERQGAVDKQEEALRELAQAKEALEEILRQLRQEEVQRMLATLEARCRKMLDMQREVYEGTVRLDKVPASQRTQSHEIDASQLSSKESRIIAEADKAQLLLREDGTATVFAEAVDQMREDMEQVIVRLAQAKVEQITQGIEVDVITAMEEMIDALKKAQKDQQQQKKKPLKLRAAEPSEPPLVDVLAELKMIRALQMRVNSRTERYATLIDGEQAEKAELVEALRRLSERETRIHRVTRDLELGRSQ